MPTSAPGTSSGRAFCARRRGAGFTLVEMLVVLVIMGLFIGLVSAIVLPDDRAVLRLEAERLAQLLDTAAAEARLTGKSIAWTGEATGYRFWRSSENSDWTEITDNDLLRARALPEGMTLSAFRVENQRSREAMRLEFSPEGSALAFTIAMALGAQRYAIAGSPVGDVRLLPGEGTSPVEAAPH